MIYSILGVLLFSFNNVLWKKNLRTSNVFFLVTYRAFFTSSFAFLIILLFYKIQHFNNSDILKITLGSSLGVLGLFCMLHVLKKESLQWIGVYNLIGIVFTSLYLWIFEKINLPDTIIGISIIIIGFIFFIVSNINGKMSITLKQHMLLLLMILCFSLSSIIHWKNLTNEIAPIFIIANQELLVFTVGLIFTLTKYKNSEILTSIKSQFYTVIMMSIVILAAILCTFLGLKIINPLLSGLLFLASPLTTILFSSIFFKEYISVKNWISIIVISTGAFIIYLQTL
jgi:drug/metabolite transporter (DMT)-like permease